MEKEKKIENKGVKSSQSSSGGYQGSSGRTREDESPKDISSKIDVSDEDLGTLEKEEFSGASQKEIQSAAYSDTDEDEDEGLGDGNLGGNRDEVR